MQTKTNFDISQIPLWKVVLVVTSPQDYEMGRVIFVEDYPNEDEFPFSGRYLLLFGVHCSCYEFNDVKWDATFCDFKELVKIATGWIEQGTTEERKMAALLRGYFGYEWTRVVEA